MEIEAKFEVPHETVLLGLGALVRIRDYSVGNAARISVHDEYLDTRDWLILRAGYACRRRKRESRVFQTLKALKQVNGPVHRREEFEIELTESSPPHEWPASQARDLVLRIIGDAPLETLMRLSQERSVMILTEGERIVAELSLDTVDLRSESKNLTFFELEIELKDHGNEDDLACIAEYFITEWGLFPQPLSKFERALTLMDQNKLVSTLLNPLEWIVCNRIARREDLYGRRRAAVLLALETGKTQIEAGRLTGMSERRVRHWYSEFRKKDSISSRRKF